MHRDTRLGQQLRIEQQRTIIESVEAEMVALQVSAGMIYFQHQCLGIPEMRYVQQKYHAKNQTSCRRRCTTISITQRHAKTEYTGG